MVRILYIGDAGNHFCKKKEEQNRFQKQKKLKRELIGVWVHEETGRKKYVYIQNHWILFLYTDNNNCFFFYFDYSAEHRPLHKRKSEKCDATQNLQK